MENRSSKRWQRCRLPSLSLPRFHYCVDNHSILQLPTGSTHLPPLPAPLMPSITQASEPTLFFLSLLPETPLPLLSVGGNFLSA